MDFSSVVKQLAAGVDEVLEFIGGGMVVQRDVLELIAKRTREERESSYRSLVKEFDISDEAACGHLKRLWDARLIDPTDSRRPRFRFRLERGESIRDLRFRLTKRGAARLRWYELKDEESWL
jgi:hypothetical protein